MLIVIIGMSMRVVGRTMHKVERFYFLSANSAHASLLVSPNAIFKVSPKHNIISTTRPRALKCPFLSLFFSLFFHFVFILFSFFFHFFFQIYGHHLPIPPTSTCCLARAQPSASPSPSKPCAGPRATGVCVRVCMCVCVCVRACVRACV